MMLRYSLLLLCGIVAEVMGQTTPGCLFTMEQILFKEEAVTDFSDEREYVVCEGRTWQLGSIDINNEVVTGSGSRSFPLRPNVHFKCGGTGDRENNCLILGGDLQVDGTNFFGVGDDMDVENVVFEGFTFAQANRYSVWATKKGDITFVDCEWKDMTDAYAPLYFDYFNSVTRNSFLDVSFVGCTFSQNTYYGDGAYPSIITANGEQNTLTIDRCHFENNDYIYNNTQFEKNSFLIESSGALKLSLNCFRNNAVGVSPAVGYGTTIESDGNYGFESEGRTCGFVSRFETQAQFADFTPLCDGFESATLCLSATTSMPSAAPSEEPTVSPTSGPTSAPTMEPSSVPTSQPSIEPSPMPTSQPSVTPTTSQSPTVYPSEVPTGVPTTAMPTDNEPSSIPTETPTNNPTGEPSTSNPTGEPSSVPPISTSAPSTISAGISLLAGNSLVLAIACAMLL